MWKDGKMHGKGKFTTKDGASTKTGVWKDGTRVKWISDGKDKKATDKTEEKTEAAEAKTKDNAEAAETKPEDNAEAAEAKTEDVVAAAE